MLVRNLTWGQRFCPHGSEIFHHVPPLAVPKIRLERVRSTLGQWNLSLPMAGVGVDEFKILSHQKHPRILWSSAPVDGILVHGVAHLRGKNPYKYNLRLLFNISCCVLKDKTKKKCLSVLNLFKASLSNKIKLSSTF